MKTIWKKTITSNIPDPHISFALVNIDANISFEKILRIVKSTIGGHFYENTLSEKKCIEIYELVKPIDFFNNDYTIKTLAIKNMDRELLNYFINGWNKKANDYEGVISLIKKACEKK